MIELVVIEGQDIGKSFPLTEGEWILGSSEKASISLSDRRISKKQLRIRVSPKGVVVENLEPRKPLLVNGEEVREATLQHGDMLTIGDTSFLFNDESKQQWESPISREEVFFLGEEGAKTQVHHIQVYDLDSVMKDLCPKEGVDHRLEILYRLSYEISASLDLDKLLPTILDILFSQFPQMDRGVILLFDEEHARFRLAYSKTRLPKEEKIKISKTVLKRTYEKKEAIISTDTQQDIRFQEGLSIAEMGIQSVMCAPLIYNQEVIGFIYVDSVSVPQGFSEEELSFLTAIAMQAAIAIAHANILRKQKIAIKKLKDLGRATQELSYYLEKRPILKKLGKYLYKILGCQRCLLALVQKGKKLSFYPYIIRSRKSEWEEQQYSLIRELCAKVVMNNAPLLISDITVDDNLYFEDHRSKTDSFLIVPIPYKSDDVEKMGKAIGAICVSEKVSGGIFTEEDQEILTILANQVGIALSNAELYEQATVDSLTGVFVRRYFFQRLEREIKRSRYYKTPLALLMMDLDHFKKKNDTYGHQAGDYVLRETGKVLKKNLREGHVIARYGGEEFAVILRETPKKYAVKIAERIRKAVEKHKYEFQGTLIPCTMSVGGTMLKEEDSLEDLIQRADQALYKAKEEGRNRVCFFE